MLSWLMTGGLLPVALVGVSVFYLIYLRGLPLSSPRGMLRALRAPRGDGVSPFRAMTLALAGTLGVGNIVGVASAIHIGGAGAIFWMWVSALAAMLLKYAEVVLAIRHRRFLPSGESYGGAIYYIRDHYEAVGRRQKGRRISGLFAVMMLVEALAMGCVLQVDAVSNAFGGVFGLPGYLSGVLFLLLLLPALLAVGHSSSALTEYLIPILTLGYLVLTVSVLCLRPAETAAAFGSILREAFSENSVAGGLLGFFLSQQLRVGTMRGLLSNEAGCGTSPTAHAAANASTPAAQGVFGIAEVFVDTVLLCTATALVVLCSYDQVASLGGTPVLMSIRAYSVVLGPWSEWFLCLAILAFAYGTVLCWSGYGAECLMALRGRRHIGRGYPCAVLLAVALGSLCLPLPVWEVSDLAITVLTGINLWMLVVMREEVLEESRAFFAKHRRGIIKGRKKESGK